VTPRTSFGVSGDPLDFDTRIERPPAPGEEQLGREIDRDDMSTGTGCRDRSISGARGDVEHL
jgi:hypothetical protein